MSLLSKFVTQHLVNDLEQEFVKHVPDLQKTLVDEVATFAQMLSDWVSSKLGHAPVDK